MSMNRQGWEGDGKSGIEWLRPNIPKRPGFTWYPCEGCTNTWCEVREDCWALSAARRHSNPDFTPLLHEERLDAPLRRKTPAIIGTCLKGDLLCDGVPDEWILRILSVIAQAPQHIFILLTKNPQRLSDFRVIWNIPNLWVGISRGVKDRVKPSIWDLHEASPRKVLSLEPLLEPLHIYKDILQPRDYGFPIGWIFIGGRSGPHPFQPPKEWIDPIIDVARQLEIPVLIKDNAGYPSTVREWPKQILEHLRKEVVR